MSSPPNNDDESDYPEPRFLAVQLNGEYEEVESYETGGFHPVHLGDHFNNGRYRVVHKLGFGGFATVWLARDLTEQKWVALKIAQAKESTRVEERAVFARDIIARIQSTRDAAAFVGFSRHFHFDGPNGRHVCLVLPVLGPLTSRQSSWRQNRIQPWLVRHAASQTARALAVLHANSLCHSDLTPQNICFRLVASFESLTEDDLLRIFGKPFTAELETESWGPTGPEAPKYIVRTLDFLASQVEVDMTSNDISIIDFDQAFQASSPPAKMLGTPPECLAPEVAAGQPAGPASDVWALGCTILRLRSGEGPYASLDIDCPVGVLRFAVKELGDLPVSWGSLLFDKDGQPTKDLAKGEPLEMNSKRLSIRDWINSIWDDPKVTETDPPPGRDDEQPSESALEFDAPRSRRASEHYDPLLEEPYPPLFSHKFWKPAAIKIDGVALSGYNSDIDEIVHKLPTIQADEADLLFDLISKIFVFNPEERVTASELLEHPWFSMDNKSGAGAWGEKKKGRGR